jgi:hypothetical protein
VLALQASGPFKGWPGLKLATNAVAEALRPLVDDLSEQMVEDTGHWIPEERPEVLADILVEFFERPAKAGQ